MTDLVYNLGIGTLSKKSPLLNKAIADGDYDAMSKELIYTKDANGTRQDGLATRSAERTQLFRGTYGKK